MTRPLPPLNSLRAFEAAARHLSFTRAAEELHVTQAAISHQVKALEARLGLRLFRRLPRALRLTEDGQALLPGLRDAFERMAAAIERLRSRGGPTVLSVSLLTTFALRWLIPRLPRFQAAHPSIEVRLITTSRLVDFAREDVDVAFRYGVGPWAGLVADKVFVDTITPLCAPALARKLKHPSDLARVPLLQDEYRDWLIWFAAIGTPPPPERRGGAVFDSTHIAVQAAMEGAGVALGSPELFVDDLATGRLVQPFDLVLPNNKAYWLVIPEEAVDQPKIRAFRDWIRAELSLNRPRAGRRAGRAAAAARRSATAIRGSGPDDASGD